MRWGDRGCEVGGREERPGEVPAGDFGGND